MKRKIALGCVLVVGCIVAFMGLSHKKESKLVTASGNGYDYYNSSLNMQKSLDDIKKHLQDNYSSYFLDRYIGTATVSETYDSFGVICDNISQDKINKVWNNPNPSKQVNNTCEIVANTMLFRKCISQGKLKVDTNENMFTMQVVSAWSSGIYTKDNSKNGLSIENGKKLANNYLNVKNSSLRANIDETLMWSTLKKYLDDKIEPVVLHLGGYMGKSIAHAVLATDCYTYKVKYKMKNFFGITTTYSKNFNIIRVCNGWEDTVKKSFAETTHSYIYEDCVFALTKLK